MDNYEEEKCFPRGRRKQNLKRKVNKIESKLSEQKNNDDVAHDLISRNLHSLVYDEDMVDKLDMLDDEYFQQDNIPYLTLKNTHEGMLILGCIVAISPEELIISLPFSVKGVVSVMHISSLFTEAYSKQFYSDGVTNVLPKLSDLFDIGQLVVCSVISVDETTHQVQLTLDPETLNSRYEASSFAPDMIICGFVKSIEDHGYIVDIGKVKVNAFIPTANLDQNMKLKRHQFVRCAITEVKGNGRIVLLSCQQKSLTNVSQETDGVEFLYPGTLVNFLPEMITQDGNTGKAGDLNACVSMLHLSNPPKDGKSPDGADQQPKKKKRKGNPEMLLKDFLIKKPRESVIETDSTLKTVCVLYTSTDGVVVLSANPNTWNISQRLDAMLNVKERFPIGRKYTAKIIHKIPKFGCVCQFHKTGSIGLVSIDNLSDERAGCNMGSLEKVGKLKVRIIDNQSLDGVIELSAKKSVYDAVYLTYDDVRCGEVVMAKVLDISASSGLKVAIGSWQDKKFLVCDLRAVVPPLHVSDIKLKRPEKVFKIGDVLTCKVLQVNKELELITLTHKKTFVQSELPTIVSYQQLNVGNIVHAYIKAIKTQGCIVGMCNNIKGFVPKNEIRLPNKDAPIYEEHSLGQVVRVRVCACDAEEEKLVMSFKIIEKTKD